MIIAVNKRNIIQAATVHSVSWKESHLSFCSLEFIEKHTPEHQLKYLSNKMAGGSKIYMLVEEKPIGIVSVSNSLIEDLYVVPDKQNMGYGRKLLRFAMKECVGTPTLWILENNTGAERLYRRIGFQETGRIHKVKDGLAEIEFSLV